MSMSLHTSQDIIPKSYSDSIKKTSLLLENKLLYIPLHPGAQGRNQSLLYFRNFSSSLSFAAASISNLTTLTFLLNSTGLKDVLQCMSLQAIKCFLKVN